MATADRSSEMSAPRLLRPVRNPEASRAYAITAFLLTASRAWGSSFVTFAADLSGA